MNVGIFHTAFVGDIALLGLAIEGLSRASHKVTLFTNSAGIELFREDNRVEKCVLVSKGKRFQKILSIFENAKKISAENLNALIVPHRSATSALTARLAGVPITIGHGDAALAFLYKQSKPRDLKLHEAFRVFEMLPDNLVGPSVKADLRALGRPLLNARPKPCKILKSFPDALDTDKPYIVIAPGSVWGTKIYPPEKFATVVSQLLNRDPNLRCLITGSAADTHAVTAFLEAMPHSIDPKRVINTLGAAPLAEIITIIAGARLVLTNDSAPVHIAAGTNTPTVAVFGPTVREAGFWPLANRSALVTYATEHGQPLECQPCGSHGPVECPLGHHRCMRDLSSQTILNAALTVMNSIS